MQLYDFFKKYGFRLCDVLNCLTRHRLGQEANKIARMAGLHGNPDFTVGFETANAWPVPGTGVDNDERPARLVDCNAVRRNDAHEGVIDGTRKGAAVENEFSLVVQHMRCGLGEMLAVGVPSLTHNVPEQNA